MATKSRYVKLQIGSDKTTADKVTSRNSHVGMTVIADYIDASNSLRYLLFERSAAFKPRAAKAKPAKQPAPAPATAFPPPTAKEA